MAFVQKRVLWKAAIWEAWGLFVCLSVLICYSPAFFFFLQLPQEGRIREKSFFSSGGQEREGKTLQMGSSLSGESPLNSVCLLVGRTRVKSKAKE